MPSKKLKLVKKFTLIPSPSNLKAWVQRSASLIVSTLEVASTGPDDTRFSDKDLTPGPATRSLSSNHSYALVWTAGFGVQGTASLTVEIKPIGGGAVQTITRKLAGKKGALLSTTILVP